MLARMSCMQPRRIYAELVLSVTCHNAVSYIAKPPAPTTDKVGTSSASVLDAWGLVHVAVAIRRRPH